MTVPEMKPGIHPTYVTCNVRCGCGNTFVTRAFAKELHVDICGSCHPFYTGKQKFIDAAGRVEKFMRRYSKGKTGAGEPSAT